MAPARSPAGRRTRAAGRPCDAQRLQVAVGLRVDQRAERIGLAGDLEVVAPRRARAAGSGRRAGRPCGTGPWSAGSAGRSPRSSRRRSCAITPRAAPTRRLDGAVVGEVAHDRQVPGGARPSSSVGQRAVGKPSGVPSLEHLRGVVLRLLDVGLVERVDAQRPARDRGRELGEEEQPARGRPAPVAVTRDRRMARPRRAPPAPRPAAGPALSASRRWTNTRSLP